MRAACGHILSAALWATACGGTTPGGTSLPWLAEGLPEPPEPAENLTTPEKLSLGRLLFYDPILSADRDTACATCHSELWGMSDGLARSIGTGGGPLTGPGRAGTRPLRRNAQTLWNVAYRDALMWDGRVRGRAGLEAQVELPLMAPDELNRDPDALTAALAQIPEYATLFEGAFPELDGEISDQTLAMALAVFERSLISDRAPYDRYVEGDRDALDAQAERGMWRFAEAGCSDCHVPPRFESERYADRGLKAAGEAGVSEGSEAGVNEGSEAGVSEGSEAGVNEGGEAAGDEGRFEVSGKPTDRRAFRVPTLRNVRETGPYFHDGREPGLRSAVMHELALQHISGPAEPFGATEVDELVAFVSKALMDRTREPDRPEAVPSGLPVPVDGFRIPR